MLALIPPKPTVSMGSVSSNSPLAVSFPARSREEILWVLFDNGASHFFVKANAQRKVGVRYDKEPMPVTLADGSEAYRLGKAHLSFTLQPHVTSRHEFILCDIMSEGIDIIWGKAG